MTEDLKGSRKNAKVPKVLRRIQKHVHHLTDYPTYKLSTAWRGGSKSFAFFEGRRRVPPPPRQVEENGV